MTVPTYIKANCLLETGKPYPVSKDYSAEDYVVESLAYNLGSKLITELPIEITPSEEVLQTGEPESYKYSVEAFVFTKAQLDEFVNEVKRAVNYDIRYMNILKNYQGPEV